MEDELWVKKIKERLENYSEPAPVSGWKRLEEKLSVFRPSITGKRWLIPFRRRVVVAAAILLAVVSSVSLWLLQSPLGNEVRRANVSVLAVVPDLLPKQAGPSVQVDVVKPLHQTFGHLSPTAVSDHSLVAQQREIPVKREQKERSVPFERTDDVLDTSSVENPVVAQEKKTETKQADETERSWAERRRPSGKNKLQLPVERESASRTHGWSVGLGVVNSGGLGNASGNGTDRQLLSYVGNTNSGRLNLVTMTDDVVFIPGGQELFFKDGLPYLRKHERRIKSIDHKQPLSFGFSLRKNLAKGFSVETGLTYTYLASDVRFDDGSEKLSQKLHYIGIPIRVNWSFVDKRSFTVYVSAGGAVEKCVYGKFGNDSKTVKPLQLSVLGALGAQYNISGRIGLYVEPGVSYFFDDGSDVGTIRKENPCNFTLQAGIRLTY